MRHLLPELIALPLWPFLVAQGNYVRRMTPRLPEAAGPTGGVAGQDYDGLPLSLLALGESPVAGVGVDRHEEAITCQLAQALSARLQRRINWSAYGKNGITVREALTQLVPCIPKQRVDIALVAFGVNDTTAFHSAARWREDVRNILTALDAQCAPRLIVLSGVPPMERFPALPPPLRWIMGLKARVLDSAARDLTLRWPHVRHVGLALDPADKTMMAIDGYHPSQVGCIAWASLLADTCARDLARIGQPAR
jgi:lysophospholipase L1-like esterase